MAQGSRFNREKVVEPFKLDFAALQACPGVGVRIGRVDGAQEARRQAALVLKAGEGIEGARQDDPAEIPKHRANGGL